MSDQKEDIITEMDEFKDKHSAKIDESTRELKDAYVSVFKKVGCLTTEDHFLEVESIVQILKNLSNLPGKILKIKNIRKSTETIYKQYSLNAEISIEKVNEIFSPLYGEFERIINYLDGIAQEISRVSKQILEVIKNKCPFGEEENRSLNAKKFERNVLELIQWLFIDELVRTDLTSIEDGSLRRDAAFNVLKDFDTQNYCGFKFTSLIVECKNYAKPSYKDLMQLFTYTLPWSDSEISKNPLCLLISRKNPTLDSTTWRIRKTIFNKPMGIDTRLILFLDVADFEKMVEYRSTGHPANVFKEKIEEFEQTRLKTF